MRTSHTARLAAAIALALAGQAYAATTAATSGPPAGAIARPAGANGTLIRSSTAIPTAVPAASGGTGDGTSTGNTTTTNTTPATNATNVDMRNLQTQQAVAGTHASGSTSALGPLANGNASVNSPTTAGTGTTSGLGATGTGSSTGGAGGVPFVVTPMYSNPADVTAGVATNGTVMANGIAGNDVYAGAVTSPDVTLAANSAVNGVSVDRAISQVSRDRKRVGRNGQLLYSIAPRTNGVDRTNQMPDDGPSPALTGSNSTLTR
jgi:hypothetical protein